MGITPQDMLKINRDLEKAQEDTTPHVGVAGENIFVMGDANKTENKQYDYEVLMRYPRSMAEHLPQESIQKVNDKYVIFTMEFKDVTITPRNDLKIVANVAQMMPFFRKLDKDGGVSASTDEELVQLAVEVGQEVLNSMYTVVGAVLDIDDDLCSHIMYPSVLELISRFTKDFPEIFNEADFSFGLPTEKA